mmetsp:Transcript_82537/g.250307  ORF Transcript_82537/g.250307 Transcript_82537/m.250307 type:complete len:204 (+) Transcript_82537:958-1569(+)
MPARPQILRRRQHQQCSQHQRQRQRLLQHHREQRLREQRLRQRGRPGARPEPAPGRLRGGGVRLALAALLRHRRRCLCRVDERGLGDNHKSRARAGTTLPPHRSVAAAVSRGHVALLLRPHHAGQLRGGAPQGPVPERREPLRVQRVRGLQQQVGGGDPRTGDQGCPHKPQMQVRWRIQDGPEHRHLHSSVEEGRPGRPLPPL